MRHKQRHTETSLRLENLKLRQALLQADNLLAAMLWRQERGESMACAFAYDTVQHLDSLGLVGVSDSLLGRYKAAVEAWKRHTARERASESTL